MVYIPFLGWGASAYRYIDRRIYEYPYIRYSLYASFFLGLCSFSVPSHNIRDCASLRCGYCGSIREQVVSTHSLMASGGRSNLHVGTIRLPRPLLRTASSARVLERASPHFVMQPSSVTVNALCHALPPLQMRRITPFRPSCSCT